MFIRILLWILRLFAWPWAARGCERWPAAPHVPTAEMTQQPMIGKAPRAKGARMGYTAELQNLAWEAGCGRPLFKE